MRRLLFNKIFSLASLVIATLLGTCAVKIIQLRSTLHRAQDRVLSLEDEVARLNAELETIRQPVTQPVDKLGATEVLDSSLRRANSEREAPPNSDSGVSSTGGANLDDRRNQWRAQQAVTEVEEQLALSEHEKVALTDEFKSYFAQGGSLAGLTPPKEVISRALGAEREAEWLSRSGEARKRASDEKLSAESIVLSRKLKLSPDQEAKALAILKEADQALTEKSTLLQAQMREAMANHFGGEETRDLLKDQYAQIQGLQGEIKRDRDRFVFDALSPVLSDEQKNALLAEQSQSE